MVETYKMCTGEHKIATVSCSIEIFENILKSPSELYKSHMVKLDFIHFLTENHENSTRKSLVMSNNIVYEQWNLSQIHSYHGGKRPNKQRNSNLSKL